MIATENEFKVHSCSEKMKCIAADCINSLARAGIRANEERATALFDDSSFLLQISPSRQAALHLFNRQFTSIAQSIKINQMDSASCCSYIKRETKFVFIYTCKNEIFVCSSELKMGEYQPVTEVCKVQHKFSDSKDGFKILSPSFSLTEREVAIVAYSQKDEFYLFLLNFSEKQVGLKLVKLNDLDNRSSGLMSWLMRQKPTHYEYVKIFPFLKLEANSLRVLCIRDNTASVLQITCNEQEGGSTIKQVYSCSALLETIKVNTPLLSASLLSQSEAVIAYSVLDKLKLVQMEITDNQKCITIDSFTTNIPQNNLKMLTCKENLYIIIRDNQVQKYKCFRTSENNLQQLTKDYSTIEPLLESADPILLSGNNRELFLVSPQEIYQLEEDFKAPSNISEEERKFQAYESWIERNFNKKIKKNVQHGSYQEVERISAEKEGKLIEQLSHLRRGLHEDSREVEAKISERVICANIIRTLIAQKEQFTSLLRNLDNQNIKNQLRISKQEDILENTLTLQSPKLIKDLLRVIVRMKMYEYLNEILEEISKHPQKKGCEKAINLIFEQVCEQAICSYKSTQNSDLYQLKLLIQSTFREVDVRQGRFTTFFSFLAKDKENATFLRNLVLNHKLIQNFMHLFINSEYVQFTARDVEEIASFLSEESRQSYLTEFFYRFKQVYAESREKSARKELMKKAEVLIKGLVRFGQEIQSIVERTFPGLCIYLYLNSENKKHYLPQISRIAEQCTTPASSYLLFLSTFAKNDKNSRQTLEKIRLCNQLKMNYTHEGDIWADIEANSHKNNIISRKDWQKTLETLEVPLETAEKLAQKLQIHA